jgi:SAM-dependent methyltransferase
MMWIELVRLVFRYPRSTDPRAYDQSREFLPRHLVEAPSTRGLGSRVAAVISPGESMSEICGCSEVMWDERFSEQGYVYGTDPNDFLVSVAGQIPGGKVLCLAEGEGRNAVFLAGLGYEVTAVDQSIVGLEKAVALAHACGVSIETVNADLADYPIEATSWQGIVSIYCHLPPPVRAALHERCLRGLAPEGVFVLEGFTPRQLELGTGGPRSRELLMELEVLRQELPGLRLEIGREIEREVVEGKYHRGTAAVVQVLAVKMATAAHG